MRFLTPEIAWHETLPIYSCDLQNHLKPISDNNKKCSNQNSNRSPLGELNFKSIKDLDPDLNWTRLATAGGDNVVRLWRVQLNWLPGVLKTTTKQTESQCTTNLTVTKQGSGFITPGTTQKTDFKQFEHLTYLASLKRHEKPVNVVRWSPSGDYLASAGDDLFIIIWSNQTTTNNGTITSIDNSSNLKDDDDYYDNAINSEIWIPCRSLRRHLEDIYDVCWSPDERALISGSVDHSIIIWHLDLIPSPSSALPAEDFSSVGEVGPENNPSNRPENAPAPSANTSQPTIKTLILRDHKHYVQGVAWDPLGFYVASLSSDRACRIYRAGTKNCLAHVSKAGKQRLFQDDSWKSFFRRLTFSPDGLLLVCPSGNLEDATFAGSTNSTMISSTNGFEQSDKIVDTAIPLVAPQHAAHIFVRSNFTRPVVSLPTGSKPVVAVRFCPQPFQLRQVNLNCQNATNQCTSLFNLAYRWLFCLILEDSVLFYDTQQTVPFAQVSQLHYQALNDASWSKDGHLVVICSTDGYCSLIHFAHGELGAFYRGTFGAPNPQPISIENAVSETDKCQNNDVEMLSSVVGDADSGPIKETNNPSKSNISSTTVPDSNKPTTEEKLSESSVNNNPTVVDGASTVSKQKRRVQLTTLVSFSDGNITGNSRTDNSQISKKLPNDFDFGPTNLKSYKFEEKDVIEIKDSSTSQSMT
ncbi:unnamed protein product [Schistosoma rodhaini]|uniref:CAF1B/HIR1 beta-propeller domain-containing protein n=1 Tax=Schistosoma rodhaini TaxID=6188 RepID=A0AA85EKG1_9TREM|nr:unnamed protein product [Schistosoma rodhaini]